MVEKYPGLKRRKKAGVMPHTSRQFVKEVESQNRKPSAEETWNKLLEKVGENRIWKSLQILSKKPIKTSRNLFVWAVEILCSFQLFAAEEDSDGIARQDVTLVLELLAKSYISIDESISKIDRSDISSQSQEKRLLKLIQRNIFAVAFKYNEILVKLGALSPKLLEIIKS